MEEARGDKELRKAMPVTVTVLFPPPHTVISVNSSRPFLSE